MITATLQAPLKLRRRLPLWVGVPDSHVWATDHSSNTLRRTQEKDRNQRKCLPSRWADGAGSQVTLGLGRAAQGFRPSAHWRLQTPPAGGCLHLLDVRVLCPKTPGHWRNARLSTDLRKPDASQRGCPAAARPDPRGDGHGSAGPALALLAEGGRPCCPLHATLQPRPGSGTRLALQLQKVSVTPSPASWGSAHTAVLGATLEAYTRRLRCRTLPAGFPRHSMQ